MNDFLPRLREVLERLTPRQKVQIVLAALATGALIWGVSAYATRVRYGVLFTRLERDDAAAVLAALEERRVAYRLAAGGTIVEVPVEHVDRLRLELAGEGLPPGGGVGFEIFDKPAFGLSDFVQNVNYRRALERELARTIQSLESVESARVHLALPPESVFADEARRPSASVVVRLRSAGTLAPTRVRAIAHLVASGVEGLDAADVSVIDGQGRMLSDGGDAGDTALSATQLEARRSMERNIETTLLSILEPVVGAGRVRARATVELNMARVQRTEETYDPNSAVVRSETKDKSRQTGAGPGGIPGTASNLPGSGPAVDAGSATREESQRTTTNFELSRTVSTIAEPVGTLERQSVAVVVDNATPAAAAGGEPATATEPRSAEEMEKITGLVRAAIGIDEKRGDVLIVQNVPFDGNALTAAPSGGAFDRDTWLRALRYLSLPLAVLLLAFLVIRPGIAALRGAREAAPTLAAVPTVAHLQARLAQQSLGEAESPLRRKLIEVAREDPKTAALVVKAWLEESRKRG
jgi:flagellar M-ring protein FliF